MEIDPQRLRHLRNSQTLSLSALAERSKISKRQLARLESPESLPKNVREITVARLAKALGVDRAVLAGAAPMPPAAGPAPARQVSTQLDPEAQLACDLIERRYGVKRSTLFNAAPLMFALLAEGSLHWRRESALKITEAANRLQDLGGSGHTAFANAASRALEGCLDEEQSIEKRDLFGRAVGHDAYELGYDTFCHNPFADYLRHVCRTYNAPEAVKLDEEMLEHGVLADFPSYEVCSGDLEKISAGSALAAYSLRMGYARIGDIPSDLWGDQMDGHRATWLEGRVPEEARRLFNLPIERLLDHQPSKGKGSAS